MSLEYPKKYAFIGLPGSGKSTFASRLGKLLNIPVHHLDQHMFEIDGAKRDKETFIQVQQAILAEKAWIVEGCSFSTFEMRFATADLLIYFKLSRLICLWRLCKRMFHYKKDFSGLRWISWELITYTWNFHRDKGATIFALRDAYPKTQFVIFKRQKEVDLFFKSMKEIKEREGLSPT